MSYHYEKETGDLVFDGFEKGIASSPHQGIGNLQGVNLQTEMGEVMCSYARTQQSQANVSTGVLAFQDSTHLVVNTGGNPLFAGNWITVTNSSHTGELANANYYVLNTNGGGAGAVIQVSSTYNGSVITGFSSGLTANFITLLTIATPVQSATEQYTDVNNVIQYRYYILDTNGYVWIKDTGLTTTGLNWFLADKTAIAPNGNATGIAVFNGYVHVFVGSIIYVKETVLLGVNNAGSVGWDSFVGGSLNSLYNSTNSHFAIVTQSNTLTYCDGAFLGTIQSSSNSGSATTVPIWSYGAFTFANDGGGNSTYTVSNQIGGSNLIVNSTITFTTSGTLPTGIDNTTLYYVKSVSISSTATTFTISTTVGGAAVNVSGGSGTWYFNTYKPSHSSGATTFIFSPQALTLPFNSISQSLCEIGNEIVIGAQSNILYFWDEINPLPNNFIPLPENNAKYMINVNNMAYIFAGSKGNIYITNGSTASAAISVPDYCAGVPGTATSYIEPYFIWGGAAYIRGRVYFSIQDQTASKAGNCGGVWSFIPTQNLFAGQDIGLALRLEAQNSYGSYSGVANIILNSQNQNANGPQYWSAWTSSVSAPVYGIDFSDTTPFIGGAKIETDIVPTGTVLGQQKKTFSNIEVKLSTPLVSGESVAVNYRKNLTEAWASAGFINTEASSPLSIIIQPLKFENTQWLQLQPVLTSTNTTPTFVRMTEIRVRTT